MESEDRQYRASMSLGELFAKGIAVYGWGPGQSSPRKRGARLWAVLVVHDRDQMERVADCGKGTMPLRAAPVTLVLVQEPGTYELDMGRMAQNIMLAADALGMATCPITLHSDRAQLGYLAFLWAGVAAMPSPSATRALPPGLPGAGVESPWRRSSTGIHSASDRDRWNPGRPVLRIPTRQPSLTNHCSDCRCAPFFEG